MMSNGTVHSAGVAMSELLCLGSLLAFAGQYLILCARYDFFDWTVMKKKTVKTFFVVCFESQIPVAARSCRLRKAMLVRNSAICILHQCK
jgi:hypothetical protein